MKQIYLVDYIEDGKKKDKFEKREGEDRYAVERQIRKEYEKKGRTVTNVLWS